jgi:hypothetical protein
MKFMPPDQRSCESRAGGSGLGMDGSNALRQFDFKISRYFLDFLEIDFKRQQAPRRRIQLKNDAKPDYQCSAQEIRAPLS